jgi:hypothetical protein
MIIKCNITDKEVGICMRMAIGGPLQAHRSHMHAHTCTDTGVQQHATRELTCMWPRPPRLRAVLIQARCTSGVSVEQASSCRRYEGEGGNVRGR